MVASSQHGLRIAAKERQQALAVRRASAQGFGGGQAQAADFAAEGVPAESRAETARELL